VRDRLNERATADFTPAGANVTGWTPAGEE
jgi:hypothetical protein